MKYKNVIICCFCNKKLDKDEIATMIRLGTIETRMICTECIKKTVDSDIYNNLNIKFF